MLDHHLAALARRGLHLPAPMVTAASWLSDAKLMSHVNDTHQDMLLVQGKSSSTFTLADGHKVKGGDLITGE